MPERVLSGSERARRREAALPLRKVSTVGGSAELATGHVRVCGLGLLV